jgi:hypothetical protein
MKNFRIIASFLLLALLVFLPLQAASAADGSIPGQFIFGQSFTLKSGETMNGDLLVFGGSATVEAGATVNGNALVFGGSLTINGDVNGDAAVFGGTARLSPTAHIFGNLSTIDSTLDREKGALVDGEVNNANIHLGDGLNTGQPVVVTPPTVPLPSLSQFGLSRIFNGVSSAVGQSVFLGLLAMLLMLFLAPQADRVAHAILAQPVTAGVLGLLTIIVFPIAIVLSVITLILIPLAPIIAIALAAALVFGWIAIGYEIGQRITKAIHQEWHPAFSAGLGTFTITLIAAGLSGIPGLNCIGWLVPALLSLAALGAVLMPRFGTQAVAATVKTTTVVPVPPQGPNPS